MILRPYQTELADRTEYEWLTGHRVVLMRLDTGGGKTAILSKIFERHDGFSCAIAHRDRLVYQISMMLARAGIRHDVIASDKTRKLIIQKQVKKLGQCFVVAGARCRVASVRTLVNRADLEAWQKQVTLWIVDEGHHVLRANEWGAAILKFTHPQCRGLLLTATAGRPDKKGLGRHADGFADVLIEGPPMRWLIDEGYLCDYDVIAPPSDLKIVEPPKGNSGDFTNTQLGTAEKNSHITGDIPGHYLKCAKGLSGITFIGTIETAVELVQSYRKLGVSAELITGNTDANVRDDIFERAEQGKLNQIIAVDVISEGVDIPALQVGSFGRLTASYVVWRQQIGRLLRPMATDAYKAATTRAERLAAIAASAKPRALLIDHIGGFVNPQLGPPDRPWIWTLDAGETQARNSDDHVPDKICVNPNFYCYKPYPRSKRACPHCGYAPEPAARNAPEHVDGDLYLMDPFTLAQLQCRPLNLDMTRGQHDAMQLAKRIPGIALARDWERYLVNRDAQISLRRSMDLFAGQLHAEGKADYEIQREFFLRFGQDVLSAQGLTAKDARALQDRIDETVNRVYGIAA